MQITRSSLEGSSRHDHEKRETTRESLLYRSPTETISASVERNSGEVVSGLQATSSLGERMEDLRRQGGSAREARTLLEDWFDRDTAGEKLYTRTIMPGASGGVLTGSGAPDPGFSGAGLPRTGLPDLGLPDLGLPGLGLVGAGLWGRYPSGGGLLGSDPSVLPPPGSGPASPGSSLAPDTSQSLIHIDDRLNLMLRMIESLSGRRIDLSASLTASGASAAPSRGLASRSSIANFDALNVRTLSRAYDTLAAQTGDSGAAAWISGAATIRLAGLAPTPLAGVAAGWASGLSASRNSAASGATDYVLSYRFDYHYRETERTEFSIQGSVSLDSGETLQISHRAVFQYQYATTESSSLVAGNLQLVDPLVVNFSGDSLQLSAERHTFDLDQDGHSDRIHFATGSTAFVALDRNRDGLINDGGELFGATSGDGFADLAHYDEDGNGFIDQGDTVFTNLLLFGKDPEGGDQIRSLADSGIAAIALTSTATPFTLRGADQQVQGVLRSSGLFITEDGRTGSLHQVDLAV